MKKMYLLKLEDYAEENPNKELCVSSNLKKLKKIALKKALKMKEFKKESWFKNKSLEWEKEDDCVCSALLADNDAGSIILSISKIAVKDEQLYALTETNSDDGAIVISVSNSVKKLKKIASKTKEGLRWEEYTAYNNILAADISEGEDSCYLISKVEYK